MKIIEYLEECLELNKRFSLKNFQTSTQTF